MPRPTKKQNIRSSKLCEKSAKTRARHRRKPGVAAKHAKRLCGDSTKVYVCGFTKANGIQVKPYCRSLPGRDKDKPKAKTKKNSGAGAGARRRAAAPARRPQTRSMAQQKAAAQAQADALMSKVTTHNYNLRKRK